MPAHMDFEYRFNLPGRGQAARRRQEGPLRVLVIGDFGGRGRRREAGNAGDLADRPILPIDVDNFENILARTAPRLELPSEGRSGPGMAVEFSTLDDFHPDALYQRLAVFEPLRRTRRRMLDPVTSAQAIAELTPAVGEPAAPQKRAPAGDASTPSPPPAESDRALVERLLGTRPVNLPEATAQLARQQIDMGEFLRRLVAPHVVPGVDPQSRELVASIDEASGALMRTVLHDPAFQALEAGWRSLHGLVTSLETGESLELHLLDVSRQELAADILGAGADLQGSGLYGLLVEKGARAPGGEPWSVMVGDYAFGTDPDDLALLAGLGAIASLAGGPFLAAADPGILGCSSLVASPDPKDWTAAGAEALRRWQALRASPSAGWIGLALPRILLRLPYGRATDPVERFDFEELTGEDSHAALLRGNPAFACARLIAEAFLDKGPSMQPGDRLDLGDLPAWTLQVEGAPRLEPCAEVYLTERAAEAILARGLMPVMSHRNRNMVRVVRFQSVADPPAPLSGPWQ